MSRTENLPQRFLDIYCGSLKLTFYITLASIPVFFHFLSKAPEPQSWREIVYIISSTTYYTSFILIIPIVLLPLLFSRCSRLIPTFILYVLIVFLIVDTVVFSNFTHHLDPAIMRMILGDFKGLGLPTALVAAFVALILALMAALIVLQRFLWRRKGSARQIKRYLAFFLLNLILFSVGSLIHIWGTNYSREEITIYDGYLPLYHPFTSHRLAPKLSNWLPKIFPPEKGSALVLGGDSGKLANAPSQAVLSFNQDHKEPQTILFIVLESWQSSTVTEDITPNLYELTQEASFFKNHISSGSVTVSGLFGLMYGTHPTLYNHVKTAPLSYPSLLTETLHARGYTGRVFTEGNLERYKLDSLLFSKLPAENFYTQPDDQLVTSYLKSLEPENSESGHPPKRYDFFFLISSHLPYYSPDDFKKFQPLPPVSGAFLFKNDTDPTPYLNAYYNSLYYLDSLIGRILSALKEKGLYDDAWIVITGDHAEEFNENGLGHWGHGNNFSRWQTAPPLIVKRPGQTAKEEIESRSLHQDVVPTLMEEALGCVSDSKLYSDGRNLYDIPPSRPAVVTSYFDTAYIHDDTVIEILRMKRYSWNDMTPLEKAPDEGNLLRSIFKDERRYFTRQEASEEASEK